MPRRATQTVDLPPVIAILGSLNIDLVARVPHHPAPGETLTSSSFAVSPGGKGANQAVACAKLSRANPEIDLNSLATATALVRMVGNVGDDSYGQLLIENLRKYDIDVAVQERSTHKTGIAMIVVDEPTGQNRIILSPEANHYIAQGEEAMSNDVLWGLAPKPDLLILQLEIPLETVVAAVRAAKAMGVRVLLNPAPAQPLPDEVFLCLDHLVMNETEAALLAGIDVQELSNEATLESVAASFVDNKGVRNVVITLGESGAFYTKATREKGLVPAERAEVVDTTAAGDTFVGQYALEVANSERFNMANAIRKANKAAARTVGKHGAQDSIPWRDEL
jgi:ribokinase